MKLTKKLRSHRGETLAETLTAVLVVALASAALAGMLGAANRLNSRVLQEDESLYLGTAQVRHGTAAPEEPRLTEIDSAVSVKIGDRTTSVDVTLRSWQDELFRYEGKTPAPTEPETPPAGPGVTS